MTTAPPNQNHPHPSRPSAGWKTSSDSSSHPDHSSTPAFTPAGTPPQNPNPPSNNRLPYLDNLESHTMDDSKPEASSTKEDAQPTSPEKTPQNESKVKDAGETKIKRAACKKHPKGHKAPKKSKKKEETSSESESSSSSSSSSSDAESSASESEESEASSSSSDEDAEAARKRRLKVKKAKKLKERRKAKSRKHKESTDEESDSESSDETETEEDTRKKQSKSKKKRRSKKSKKEADESESEDEEDDDDLARAKAQLSSLGLRRRAGRQTRNSRGGRSQIDDRTLRKALKAKKDKSSRKKKRYVSALPLMHILP